MRTSLDLGTPANLRDVGGLTTADGRLLRSGTLLRSDAPQPGDRLPVVPATVVDLRSEAETRGRTHPLAGVAEVHAVPLGTSLAPEVIAATPEAERDLAWMYRLLVREAAGELAGIVRLFAHAPGPVLVHCAAGKDRTGIVVAVALRLVGVPREQVVADYLRTNDNLAGLLARLEAAGAHLPALSDGTLDPQTLLGVDEGALTAALAELERHPGGVHGHLLAHGATAADLDALTARLVDRP